MKKLLLFSFLLFTIIMHIGKADVLVNGWWDASVEELVLSYKWLQENKNGSPETSINIIDNNWKESNQDVIDNSLEQIAGVIISKGGVLPEDTEVELKEDNNILISNSTDNDSELRKAGLNTGINEEDTIAVRQEDAGLFAEQASVPFKYTLIRYADALSCFDLYPTSIIGHWILWMSSSRNWIDYEFVDEKSLRVTNSYSPDYHYQLNYTIDLDGKISFTGENAGVINPILYSRENEIVHIIPEAEYYLKEYGELKKLDADVFLIKTNGMRTETELSIEHESGIEGEDRLTEIYKDEKYRETNKFGDYPNPLVDTVRIEKPTEIRGHWYADYREDEWTEIFLDGNGKGYTGSWSMKRGLHKDSEFDYEVYGDSIVSPDYSIRGLTVNKNQDGTIDVGYTDELWRDVEEYRFIKFESIGNQVALLRSNTDSDTGEHIHTAYDKKQNEKKSTCTKEGYTGDIICSTCGEIMSYGDIIPALGHTYNEPVGVIYATCLKEGYSGDRECAVCGFTEYGSVTPVISHDYDENHTCRSCEWKEPGLYIDGKLEIDWAELIQSGYVTVQGTRLTGISDSIYGLLVISEDITELPRMPWSSSASSRDKRYGPDAYYIPRTIVELPYGAFYGSSMKSIRFFGDNLKTINNRAFYGCINLEEFTFPQGVTRVGSEVFLFCESLKEIHLNDYMIDNWESLDLTGMISLEYIDWPKNLKKVAIEDNCAIEELTLPATVEELRGGFLPWVRDLVALKKLDISSTKIKGFDFYWSNKDYCLLEEIDLPETAEHMKFTGAEKIRLLILPEGFNSLHYGANETLEAIVWPVTLTASNVSIGNYEITSNFESDPISKWKALKTIYYRGSQLKWKLSGLSDVIPENINIVFDVTDETIEQLKNNYYSKTEKIN